MSDTEPSLGKHKYQKQIDELVESIAGWERLTDEFKGYISNARRELESNLDMETVKVIKEYISGREEQIQKFIEDKSYDEKMLKYFKFGHIQNLE